MNADANSARGRVGHMSSARRWVLYGTSLAVWLTGAVWLIFRYFIQATDSFGFASPHPAQKWWLIGHAVTSFYGLWWFGLLWPNHVKKSWKAHIRRWTGGVIFGCTAWLALSGCALYYIGNEEVRSWFSLSHWVVGLAALVAFVVHLRTRTPRA